MALVKWILNYGKKNYKEKEDKMSMNFKKW